MSAVLSLSASMKANRNAAIERMFRPVLTVADEELIRFVIYAGDNDDTGEPEFDEFEVDRKNAAAILRKHHREGSYIDRRDPVPARGSYAHLAFGHYYIQPKGQA